MALAWGSATHLDDAERFRRFLEQGGYVDQKRLDALALLEHLASLGDRSLRSDRVAEPTARTCFIRRLQYEVTCHPPDDAEGDLPQDERVASEARSLGAVYPLLQRLARLMAMAHVLASHRRLVATPQDVGRVYERYEFGVGPAALTKRWSQARDLNDAALASFVERLALIGALLADASRQLSPSKRRERYESALLALLRIDGRYDQWRSRRSSRSSSSRAVVRHAARQADAIGGLYRRTATVWSALDGVLDELGLMPFGQMQAHPTPFDDGAASRGGMPRWRGNVRTISVNPRMRRSSRSKGGSRRCARGTWPTGLGCPTISSRSAGCWMRSGSWDCMGR